MQGVESVLPRYIGWDHHCVERVWGVTSREKLVSSVKGMLKISLFL